MTATEAIVANKKFNIKFSMKRIEATLDVQSCGLEQLESFAHECNHSSSGNKSNGAEMKKMHSIRPSDGGKKLDPAHLKAKPSMPGSRKRGPPLLEVCQKDKRLRMDRSLTYQCSTILKKLMTHPDGWVFNQPVDPVALNIPDYLLIITKPMDLGTIKSKLEKNMYFSSEEFAADIRLTFSNAMHYNPPDNSVHKMAQKLNYVFETRWKSLIEKWNCENSKVGQVKPASGRMKEGTDSRQDAHKAPPLNNNLLHKKSLPPVAVEKIRSSDGGDLEVSNLLTKTGRVWDRTGKLSGNNFHKGMANGSRHGCGSVNAKPPSSSNVRTYVRCGVSACHCSRACDATNASTSDLSLERSLDRDHYICSFDAARQAKSMPVSCINKLDPHSDGAVSALDYEIACLSSHSTPPTTDAIHEEGCPYFDVQLSPKKAIRVAMLKSRFAETILKAQHKTLLDHGDKADTLKMQQEKEKLERRQREERTRIEAQMKVAKAALQIREQSDLKQQRERERETARAALRKIKKAVHLEENLWIQKELDMLLGSSLSCSRTLLEQLGLFIKDEGMEYDEMDMNVEGEEGEIF